MWIDNDYTKPTTYSTVCTLWFVVVLFAALILGIEKLVLVEIDFQGIEIQEDRFTNVIVWITVLIDSRNYFLSWIEIFQEINV